MVEFIIVLAALATIGGFLIKPVSLFLKKIKKDKLPQKNDAVEAKKTEERAEAAKALIVLTKKIQKAMNEIRNPFSEKINITDVVALRFRYHDTGKLIDKHKELFENLYDDPMCAKTIIGDVDVDKAIEKLLMIYDNLKDDIEKLIFHAQHGKNNSDQELELERKVYKNENETDPVSKNIKEAIETIQTRLTPIVQMNE